MGRTIAWIGEFGVARLSRGPWARFAATSVVIAAAFWPALPASAVRFPCTEQGIRDAITLGGGPHTFACDGPTTVATAATIFIDNDVILDGADRLTVDGGDAHLVFRVEIDITARLQNLTVSAGMGSSGGGILNAGTLHIQNSTISGNTASSGGGIFNAFFKTLTLTNSIVSNNTSTTTSLSGGGGGIYNTTGGSVTLTNSTVSGNFAQKRGGGIFNLVNGSLVLTSSVVSDNELLSANSYFVDGGGGIYHGSGTLAITNSTVAGNSADSSTGSGIMTLAGTVSITNSTISDNGGLFGISGIGGGIYNDGATMTITNTTFSGNGASEVLGGDAIRSDSGAVTLTSCTVADNGFQGWPSSAISGPGITLQNTLLANPLIARNCSGAATTNGGNVESPADTCSFTDPSDQVNVTAGALALGSLADNGGPTLTHDLLAGSVAIDTIAVEDCVDSQGVPLLTDQRGAARPQGLACDAGAVEVPEPATLAGGLAGIGGLVALARGRRRSRGARMGSA